MTQARREPPGSLGASAAVAAGAFVAFIMVLVIVLFKAQLLADLGLLGSMFFVVRVFLGLCAAAFLFGVLRSYATYRGEAFGGKIELGGPVVVFMLVVLVGKQLEPPLQSPFALTVIVHGEEGRQHQVLRGKGRVILTVGGDQVAKPIGAEGQAFFPSIPAAYRAKAIPVALDADGYEPASQNPTLALDGNTAWLGVRARAAVFTGHVRATDGTPVPVAAVSAAGVSTTTDPAGFFRLAVPGAAAAAGITLQVTAAGYQAWHETVVPGGNEIGVILMKHGPGE